MSSPTPQERARENMLRKNFLAASIALPFFIQDDNRDTDTPPDTSNISAFADDSPSFDEFSAIEDNSSVTPSSSPMQQRLASEIQQKHAEQLKREATRTIAKGAGNAGNATGSVGWDGFISFITTYLHIMARGVVSILSPEPTDPNTASPSQQILHTFIPPYRPLKEPGDFLYFLALFAISSIVLLIILGLVLLLFSLFIFPVFMSTLTAP